MKRYFINIKLYSCIGLMIVSVLVPLKVLAVDYGFYSANDIMFYDPSTSETTDPNNQGGSGEEIGMECYKIIGVGEPGNVDVLSRIVSFYRGKLKDTTIAAIAGNFQQESGFNVYNINQSYSSRAYGLAQWLGSRKKALFDSSTASNGCPTLDEQLAFSWVEMTGSYKWIIDEMEKQDVNEAVQTFVDHYEAPSPEEIRTSIAIRKQYANVILKHMQQ